MINPPLRQWRPPVALLAVFGMIVLCFWVRRPAPNPRPEAVTLTHLATQLKHLRKEVSKLTCEQYGVSATGAFCVPNPLTDEFRAYRARNFDGSLAAALSTFFLAQRASSVADVGGSIGLYSDAMSSAGVMHVTCYDGADNIEGATGGKVKHLDVTDSEGSKTLGRHDWVLCLEVAEHVPRAFEDVLVDLLVHASQAGLIISWAPPGQTGHHHVNERPHDQVNAMLTARGMRFDEGTTQALRSAATLPQFRNNLLVYRR